MARKRIRVSRRILFTYLLLAGFIFLFAPQNLTNKFQLAFARIFRWPLSIGKGISLSARAQQASGDLIDRREYNKLQNHLANVTQQWQQERQKAEKLSGLRSRLPLEGAKLVSADVITGSVNGLQNGLIINRGQKDGLARGQFVLGDNSIIGNISDVSSHTARVKLATDSSSNIAVRIAKLDIDRLMQGAGNNSAQIRLLSIKHKVRSGDNVYACKKPGLLDTPMIIATVAQCRRDGQNPSLWDITVKPACDIENLNEVAVIITNPKE